MTLPLKTPVWSRLLQEQRALATTRIASLFQDDPDRFARFSRQLDGLLFDFSKNPITQPVFDALIELAESNGLRAARESLFGGGIVNPSENRSAMHVALRAPMSGDHGLDAVAVNGKPVLVEVERVRTRMAELAHAVHSGSWLGYTGKRITDVVNIGIGGSELGPKTVLEALEPFWVPGITPHFISNLDCSQLHHALAGLNPETTLFIVSSKSFTTQETMSNWRLARRWFVDQAGEAALVHHALAATVNVKEAVGAGFAPGNIFEFWDWVGGRYSLWSSVGLIVALTVGYDHFAALLDGAHRMDRHFLETPFENNLPILLALVGIWNRNFMHYDSKAILPYDYALRSLHAHLQQVDMESNGKNVDVEGNAVSCQTGPILWGGAGSNGQHAFFQYLHQGTSTVPVDFICAINDTGHESETRKHLVASMIAQSEALMEVADDPGLFRKGKEAFMQYNGNTPSNAIMLDELSPRNLGMLLAMYEHAIFTQAAIWNINPFDQWGVDIGKKLAGKLWSELDAGEISGEHDSSTVGLSQFFLKHFRNGNGN